MFQRVIVVMPGTIESRDALVLGSQCGAPCVVLLAPVGHRFQRPVPATHRNGVARSSAT